MKDKIKSQKGFIQIPLLIAIITGILAIGGISYFGVEQYRNYQEKNKALPNKFENVNVNGETNDNEITNESTPTQAITEINPNNEVSTKNTENQTITSSNTLIKSEQDANQQHIEEVLKDISPEVSIIFNNKQDQYVRPYVGDAGRISYRIYHASECHITSTISECPSFDWRGNYTDIKSGNCFVPFNKIETLLFNIKCTNENEYKDHKGSTEKELKIDVIQNQQAIIQPEPEQDNSVNTSLSFNPSNLSGVYYLDLNKPLGIQWFGQNANECAFSGDWLVGGNTSIQGSVGTGFNLNSIERTYTYTLTCSNKESSDSETIKIDLKGVPKMSIKLNGSVAPNYPIEVTKGELIKIDYEISNLTKCQMPKDGGDMTTLEMPDLTTKTGSASFVADKSVTYQLSCENPTRGFLGIINRNLNIIVIE
ncbi:MAG: hypothetical protein WC705_02270 [Candidatus Paceibacterota bacterium]|jgi:flagellar basal body-associated protein FliL